MNTLGTSRYISHLQINCSNISESISYYKILGFDIDRVISDAPTTPSSITDFKKIPTFSSEDGVCICVGMALKTDHKAETRLELMQWLSPEKSPSNPQPSDSIGLSRVALTVSQLEELKAKLEKNGYQTEQICTVDINETLSSKYVHIHDPDGVWLTLMEWYRR